jgi:hypothetical protein
MTQFTIDTSRFQARYARLPLDTEMGAWTFIIDSEPVRFFGSFAEARSLAKLYARMHDHATDAIELDQHGAIGRVYENLS